MIISTSVEESAYPQDGRFQVQGYLRVKQQYQTNLLKGKLCAVISVGLFLENVFLFLIAFGIFGSTSDISSIITYRILASGYLLVNVACSYFTFTKQINFLTSRNMNLAIQILLPLIIAITCLLPLIQYTKYNFRKRNNLQSSLSTIQLQNSKIYFIVTQLFLIVRIYTLLVVNYKLNRQSNQDSSNLEWGYLSFLALLNILFVHLVLQLQQIVCFNENISTGPDFCNSKIYTSSTIAHENLPPISQKKISYWKRRSCFIWQIITFIETSSQFIQSLVFLLLCLENKVMATIAIILWNCFSIILCYSNVSEVMRSRAGEVNTIRSLFFGFRIDYLCAIRFLEYKQLRMYSNIKNTIKLCFVLLFKLTLVILALIAFTSSEDLKEKDVALHYLNMGTLLIDGTLFILKVPTYYRIFIRRSRFGFDKSFRPDQLKQKQSISINGFNKSINIIVHEQQQMQDFDYCELDDILRYTDRMIFYELTNQVRIYNKFGHFEIQIIKFNYKIIQWIELKVKSYCKTLRIMVFSMYNNRSNLRRLTKEVLLQLAFDSSSKFDQVDTQIIDQLPASYFPKEQLEFTAKEYGKQKVCLQMIVFYQNLQPFLFNHPQVVLYDLIE